MVIMLLGTGFEESEAVVPLDLLRRAGVEVSTAGVTDTQVTSSHGITVAADCALSQVDPAQVEMVILPGGLGGVDVIGRSQAALKLVGQVYKAGGYVAAICAGPTILAKLGITDGRKAVCYPGMEGEMGQADMQAGVTVAVDGNVITGQAAGAAFDFGLKLVELLKGAAAAEEVRHAVHYHR